MAAHRPNTIALFVWLIFAICGAAWASYDCTDTSACTVTCDGTNDHTDINSAITDADAGSTVSVGSGTCDIASQIDINKSITLAGNGVANTTFDKSAGTYSIDINLSSDVAARVTGIKFTGSDNQILIAGPTDGTCETQHRIDNNEFGTTSTGSSDLIFTTGCVYGVIDNNDFTNGDRTIFIGGDQDETWTRPITAGTANALFIEDNTFTNNNNSCTGLDEQIYHSFGHRTVTRYNTFDATAMTGCIYWWFDSHGNWSTCGDLPDRNTTGRGQPIIEVYNNTIDADNTSRYMNIRGGSMLMHDNTFTTTTGTPVIVELAEEESWTSGGPWSGCVPVDSSWSAQDQVFNTFIWNNTHDGTLILVDTDDSEFIQEDRDYFLHAPQATGGSESWGTPGDHGTLSFNASGANAYYPYTPYGYPHPLQGEKYSCSGASCTVTCDNAADDLAIMSAISLVDDGGTITIGAGSCDIEDDIQITKALTLQGAGKDSTILYAATSIEDGFYDPIIVIDLASDLAVRITGLQFNGTLANGKDGISIEGSTSGAYALTKVRIDNNRFDEVQYAVTNAGRNDGVVDSNEFHNCERCTHSNGSEDDAWGIGFDPYSGGSGTGNFSVGTSQFWFVEDNTFTRDSSYPYGVEQIHYLSTGSRSVFRYNTVDFSAWEDDGIVWDSHGNQKKFDEDGKFRGQPVMEMYGNNITVDQTFGNGQLLDLRSGSALIWNNTFVIENPGSLWGVIEIWEEETRSGSGQHFSCCDFSGVSYGNIADGCSNDSLQCFDYTWPTEDMVTNTFIWDNTINGSALTNAHVSGNGDEEGPDCCGTYPDSGHVVNENRDFWMHAPAASGGRTYYDDRAGAAGNAADGTLVFTGSGANAYYPYTPYVYPHPLRGVTDGVCDSETSTCSGFSPWRADSASYADVNYCVNTCAASGDTVHVPAGTETWSSQLVMTKGVNLIGAGVGLTDITSTYAPGGTSYSQEVYFSVVYNPTDAERDAGFRLSGFEFDFNNDSRGIGIFNETTNYWENRVTGVQLDNNLLSNADYELVVIVGPVNGVAYQNTLDRSNASEDGIHHFGTSGDSADGAVGNTIWANVSWSFGTADNFYWEDNTYVTGSTYTGDHIDSEGGGRYVSRFNRFENHSNATGTPIHNFHGSDAVRNSSQGCEVYHNTESGGKDVQYILQQRGGSCVAFNNHLGTSGTGVGLIQGGDYAASCNVAGCDEDWTNSQAPDGQPQYPSNSYYWGNTVDSESPTVSDLQCQADYSNSGGGDFNCILDPPDRVVPVRTVEYYDDDTSGGVTSGLRSARPATCTAGHAYWATDQGEWNSYADGNDGCLDKCTATDTWSDCWYTPYTYPHPLRGTPTAVWITPTEIQALPRGADADWTSVLAISNSTWETTPDIVDQDSDFDMQVLAGALTCVANGTNCSKAVSGLLTITGSECDGVSAGDDWLGVSRNIQGYSVAADILRRNGDLAGEDLSAVEGWLRSFLTGTETCARNASPEDQIVMKTAVWVDASNADSQAAGAYAALAAYFNDTVALDYLWDRNRLFSCDLYVQGQFLDAQHMADEVSQPSIPVGAGVTKEWTHDDTVPCGVNPAGSTRVVSVGQPGAGETHTIDGVIPNDEQRGDTYQWPPVNPWTTAGTIYPWVALEGLVPMTVILDRFGYLAWQLSDWYVCRAIEYQYYLTVTVESTATTCTTGDECHWDFDRDPSAKHLAHLACTGATNYNSADHDDHEVANGSDGIERTFSYTDWTHPTYTPLTTPSVFSVTDTFSGVSSFSGGSMQ